MLVHKLLGFGVWGLGFGVWGLGFGIRTGGPRKPPRVRSCCHVIHWVLLRVPDRGERIPDQHLCQKTEAFTTVSTWPLQIQTHRSLQTRLQIDNPNLPGQRYGSHQQGCRGTIGLCLSPSSPLKGRRHIEAFGHTTSFAR